MPKCIVPRTSHRKSNEDSAVPAVPQTERRLSSPKAATGPTRQDIPPVRRTACISAAPTQDGRGLLRTRDRESCSPCRVRSRSVQETGVPRVEDTELVGRARIREFRRTNIHRQSCRSRERRSIRLASLPRLMGRQEALIGFSTRTDDDNTAQAKWTYQ